MTWSCDVFGIDQYKTQTQKRIVVLQTCNGLILHTFRAVQPERTHNLKCSFTIKSDPANIFHYHLIVLSLETDLLIEMSFILPSFFLQAYFVPTPLIQKPWSDTNVYLHSPIHRFVISSSLSPVTRLWRFPSSVMNSINTNAAYALK